MKRDHVAWECPECGYRHAWKWRRGEAWCCAGDYPVQMHCQNCAVVSPMRIAQIGKRVWVGVWDTGKAIARAAG